MSIIFSATVRKHMSEEAWAQLAEESEVLEAFFVPEWDYVPGLKEFTGVHKSDRLGDPRFDVDFDMLAARIDEIREAFDPDTMDPAICINQERPHWPTSLEPDCTDERLRLACALMAEVVGTAMDHTGDELLIGTWGTPRCRRKAPYKIQSRLREMLARLSEVAMPSGYNRDARTHELNWMKAQIQNAMQWPALRFQVWERALNHAKLPQGWLAQEAGLLKHVTRDYHGEVGIMFWSDSDKYVRRGQMTQAELDIEYINACREIRRGLTA